MNKYQSAQETYAPNKKVALITYYKHHFFILSSLPTNYAPYSFRALRGYNSPLLYDRRALAEPKFNARSSNMGK